MAKPVHPKVVASGVTGALITVVVAALAAFGIVIPPAVVAAAVTVISFIAAYVKSAYEGS